MFQLAQELGIGVVATNDAHYLKREDASAHDVLLAIGTGKDLNDPKRSASKDRELSQVGRRERRVADRDDLFKKTRHRKPASSTSRSATFCPSFPPRRRRHRRDMVIAPREEERTKDGPHPGSVVNAAISNRGITKGGLRYSCTANHRWARTDIPAARAAARRRLIVASLGITTWTALTALGRRF